MNGWIGGLVPDLSCQWRRYFPRWWWKASRLSHNWTTSSTSALCELLPGSLWRIRPGKTGSVAVWLVWSAFWTSSGRWKGAPACRQKAGAPSLALRRQLGNPRRKDLMNHCTRFRGGCSWTVPARSPLCLLFKERKGPTRMPWLSGRFAPSNYPLNWPTSTLVSL